MAFITTNPSPYIINVPELQNVITSASGATAGLSNSITDILTYVNIANSSASFNTISAYNTSYLSVTNNLNLCNAGIYMNGTSILTSNTLNGIPYIAFQTQGVERARLTSGGLGLQTVQPLAVLDVKGSALMRDGSIYISSMGAPLSSTIGNLYADGDLFAMGIKYPSDPVLKDNIRPYAYGGVLPQPVEFTWKRNGHRDIGVLATEIAAIEPVCVQRTHTGTATVDYPKLTVLCLAELHELRKKVTDLEARLNTHI